MNTITLPTLVKAWGQPDFTVQAKNALLNIKQDDLPLYKATENGGFVVENKIDFSIQSAKKNDRQITIKCFVFFYELVVGCGCGDEPFELPITCEMECIIDTTTAEANFSLLPS